MEKLFTENINDMKIKEMQDILKEIGSFHSFKSKKEYIQRLQHYKNNINFPWRTQQREVINAFLDFKHKSYIIHAIFGAGKSTLLIGMLIHGILKKLFTPEDIMFVSFNISIKNEIKRKLKEYGISSKVCVRTFDSVIYELAKIGEYPHIDLPNFEGKRKFVYELIFNKEFTHIPEYQPKVMFIDEAQDLEKSVLDVLQHFFPNTKFVFCGDIFQSVQKEARETLLWYYMKLAESPDIYKIYMSDTPRVPSKNLNTLKTALSIHYPEFKENISQWTSSNTKSDADIEWKRFHFVSTC